MSELEQQGISSLDNMEQEDEYSDINDDLNDMKDLIKKVEGRIEALEGELKESEQKINDMESKESKKQPAEKEVVDGQEALEDQDDGGKGDRDLEIFDTNSNDGSQDLEDDKISDPEQVE